MSQINGLLELLREGPKTLNQILASPFGLAAVYRGRISDLRQEGYTITHHKYKNCPECKVFPAACPALSRRENVYRLEGEPALVEQSGQFLLAGCGISNNQKV